MRTLATTSIRSVLCTVSILMYGGSQLLASGMITVGGLFEIMVVLPTIAGLITACIGVIAGAVALTRRTNRQVPAFLIAAGQTITVAGAVAVAFWAVRPSSSGWDLLLLPLPLVLGQIVVFTGLIVRGRRRGIVAAP